MIFGLTSIFLAAYLRSLTAGRYMASKINVLITRDIKMKHFEVLKLLLIFFSLSFNSIADDSEQTISKKSVSEGWDREYGIGVIKNDDMYSYTATDTIFTEPNVNSKIKAILDSRSLIFADGKNVFSYKRMIEFDYEVPGFAILNINNDTSWAEVTLDPYSLLDPPTGWINLNKVGTSLIMWSDLLASKNYLFFLNPVNIQFFSNPNEINTKSVKLEKFNNSDKFDYIMKPLSRNGNWLKIELLTPSPYCKSDEIDVTPVILWIKYLRKNQRPNVFFYTRGC